MLNSWEIRMKIGVGDDYPLIAVFERGNFKVRAIGGSYVKADATNLIHTCVNAWGVEPVVFEIETKKGTRPATAAELASPAMYGEAVAHEVVDLTLNPNEVAFDRSPAGSTLRRAPFADRPIPEAKEDPRVAAWLRALGGPHYENLIRWIVYLKPKYRTAQPPSLVWVKASNVGKSVFAEACALTLGASTIPLRQALQKFNPVLAEGSVLFGDEGMPRDSHSRTPLTQELRELITKHEHKCEEKGKNERLKVRGTVRVILAANDVSSLFGGMLSPEDVDALRRRFLAISVDGERAKEAKELAVGLGSFDNDPARLETMASHFRWIQENMDDGVIPVANAKEITAALREGTDLCQNALAEIEDQAALPLGGTMGVLPTACVDRAAKLVWYMPKEIALAVGKDPSALARALKGYRPANPEHAESRPYRKHPVNGTEFPLRQRWAALDLDMLAQAGRFLPEPEVGDPPPPPLLIDGKPAN